MDVSLIVFTLPLQSLIGVAEKQQASIQITFPLVPGQDGDFSERQVFWDSPATIQWFKAHGYTLYRRVDDSFTTYPVISALNVATTEANYPYACYDLGGPEAMSELPRADEYTVSFPVCGVCSGFLHVYFVGHRGKLHLPKTPSIDMLQSKSCEQRRTSTVFYIFLVSRN